MFTLSSLLGACAVHEPVPVVRSAIFVGDRGITVPLPPPSLTATPEQEVEVEGEIDGPTQLEAGTVVRVVDNRGSADVVYELSPDERTFSVTMRIDVTDSCLELWLETPKGQRSAPTLVSTRVVSQQDVAVVDGCED